MLEALEERCVGLKPEVFRETRSSLFLKLQDIYELVADAPFDASPGDLRRQSCQAFAELFESTNYLVFGEEYLPEEPGHIFIMNHLSNHLNNLLPGCFVPTLDTHFVSAMILNKKYGEPPVRVVRESSPDEHEHKRYYDRLGHIYVRSGNVNPLENGSNGGTSGEHNRLFLTIAGERLREGKNIVICPEGISTETDFSPMPFKAGAFRLAAYVRPEPLLVPIAVANFDKEITRTKTVAVVHEPIRLSEHLGEAFDDRSLYEFINGYVHERFHGYVREAVQLGS